jgi:hypothetical protein
MVTIGLQLLRWFLVEYTFSVVSEGGVKSLDPDRAANTVEEDPDRW